MDVEFVVPVEFVDVVVDDTMDFDEQAVPNWLIVVDLLADEHMVEFDDLMKNHQLIVEAVDIMQHHNGQLLDQKLIVIHKLDYL